MFLNQLFCCLFQGNLGRGCLPTITASTLATHLLTQIYYGLCPGYNQRTGKASNCIDPTTVSWLIEQAVEMHSAI